jgi:hypothetical protein
MNMPTTIQRTIHIASDGKEFYSHNDALSHELESELANVPGCYMASYTCRDVAAFLVARYDMTPKPAAVLLTEDPDHA